MVRGLTIGRNAAIKALVWGPLGLNERRDLSSCCYFGDWLSPQSSCAYTLVLHVTLFVLITGGVLLLLSRLDVYIHDYLVRKGMNTTAEALAREANVNPGQAAVNCPGGFLAEWWDVFYDIFNSNQAEQAQEPYAEVPRTMDNAVPYIPSGFNPDSKIKIQEQGNLVLPDEEVTSKLRILEVDDASHRVPSATVSSPPVQQMPNMPQQWEARDETSGIYFGRTKQMDPNPCGPTKALLPTTGSSDAGSSTGSCS